MAIRAYCRVPEIKKRALKPKEGGCPELLEDLFLELSGAEEIHVATYLFNNPTYYKYLSSLAKQGSKIFVTTLPERGYGNKKLKVEGYNEKISGRDMAKQIFSEIKSTGNIDLRFFPHQYVWYGALYAGGGPSYSFHIKAAYAKYPKGKNKCILSSGNFMFTDPYHSDSLLIFEREPTYEKIFSRFFADLEDYSIPCNAFYHNFLDYKKEFLMSYSGHERMLNFKELEHCFFTAPFYLLNGIGSNHYAGNRIIELIRDAKERVWVCAQHFHDVISFDRERESIVKALYEKADQSPKIELRFLKQVPNYSLADKRRAAITETIFQYVTHAAQRFNRLTHDKFILVDDTLLFSTANYTPTQFAFGLRKMEYKNADGEKITKEDNFSEVNGFAIVPKCPKEVINQFEEHFDKMWDDGEEISINL